MKISDITVTKAGGLTVTESLTMGLPMIFFFLIPGQEMINAKTMVALKAGFIAESPDKIKDLILELQNNPALLTAYRQACLSLAKPHSSQDIVALIEN